ncbi:penicillin-binding transpeptidase domain-containing protein [Nakamurella endophytica]|uniref:Penicillin-binding protein A n=1 Tax=Nakamurella endophytica TaxID=1748367 RepID=A0A917SWP0_9ACTN|nr:penicillin-binding protein 2 [Nakamurella endophytica]GGM00156.1 penicillin-binding protein A [Nakamurella endophytica]
MRRPVRNLGTAVMVLVVLLLANLTYLQVVRAGALRNDPHNSRTLLEEYSRQRGQIIAAGGVVLARSDPSNDAFRYQRKYPGGAMYQAVTGYYSSVYGATGIERAQNGILSGDDDSLLGDQLSDLLTGRDPRGGNVYLSLVPAVQKAAWDGLTANGYTGAVVAIKPQTGAILAMATTPSYDPSPLASHSEAVQRRQSAIINSSVPSPRTNRAIGAVYPPGSTFKLVVSGAALQHGYNPQSRVTGASRITLPGGGSMSNFENETCGDGDGSDVTLTTALAFSCNTAFAEVGMSIGAQAIKNQGAALGIDPDGTNVGLDVVGSRMGDMPDAAAVAQSSIGQRDVALTPLQDAVIAATIADHGTRMHPYLVQRTTRPDLSVIDSTEPVVDQQDAMPAAVADQVRDMMIESEKETPGAGQIADLVIASKTGTAEHGTDPKNTPPHAWYVAFAPAEDPQVAVAVLVENGGNGALDATGGKVAAPIGRSVIAAALSAGS